LENNESDQNPKENEMQSQNNDEMNYKVMEPPPRNISSNNDKTSSFLLEPKKEWSEDVKSSFEPLKEQHGIASETMVEKKELSAMNNEREPEEVNPSEPISITLSWNGDEAKESIRHNANPNEKQKNTISKKALSKQSKNETFEKRNSRRKPLEKLRKSVDYVQVYRNKNDDGSDSDNQNDQVTNNELMNKRNVKNKRKQRFSMDNLELETTTMSRPYHYHSQPDDEMEALTKKDNIDTTGITQKEKDYTYKQKRKRTYKTNLEQSIGLNQDKEE